MKNSLLFCLTLPWTLCASPTGLEVISGDASVNQVNTNHLQIHASNKAILHWKQFGVEKGKHVQFVQPSSKSAVLNRVKGKEVSSILGKLSANGKVYLLNPHGVIIGKDAIIQTADFLASTLDVSNDQFLNGAELLFKGDSTAAIINYGTIVTGDGNITLLARNIDNNGTLSAKKGTVSLAAAGEILLQLQDVPLLTIRPSLEPNSHINQKGTIETLVAQLQTEGSVHHYGINLEGSVTALNTVEKYGRIFLQADSLNILPQARVMGSEVAIETTGFFYQEGYLRADILDIWTQGLLMHVGKTRAYRTHIDSDKFFNSGLINSPRLEIGTKGSYIETATAQLISSQLFIQSDSIYFSSGVLTCPEGRITLIAPTITLVSATLDASSENNGGKIFIGGGKHGENLGKPNAQSTRLSGDTKLLANSTQKGKGGTIVVWSDENTVTYGTMQANAGPHGGNGGFIEVSSRETLHCFSEMSANAPHGKPGKISLDPKNIVIDSVTGVYPQYEFINPGTATPLTNGNYVVRSTLRLSSLIPNTSDPNEEVRQSALHRNNWSKKTTPI